MRLPLPIAPPLLSVIVYWLLCASAAHAANLTASALVTTTNRTVTLLLALPPVPLSCDSANDANLMGYWKLDEPSGDAIDSKGANTLTDNNGVTTEVGKIGTSRYFTSASNKHLSIPDNAALSSVVTCGAWVNFGGTLAIENYPGIMSKWTALPGQREFALYLNGDNQKYEFAVSGDGSTPTIVTATNFAGPGNQMWHLVIGWVDSGSSTINIQIDGGTPNSIPFVGTVFDGTANFCIGSGADDGSAGWTGTVDEAFFSNRVLTPIECQDEYNHGLACRPGGLNP